MKFEHNSFVKIAGITSLMLGVFGFCFLMQYFHLFNTTIDFKNPAYVSKMLSAQASLVAGLYVGLYLLGGRWIALIMGGGFALLFLAETLFGVLGWHVNILALLFSLYLGWVTYDGLRTGRLHYRAGDLTRKQNPLAYWAVIILCSGLLLLSCTSFLLSIGRA
jgi:hypothetical protein